MKTIAEIATPFDDSEPEELDFYMGSTFGFDLIMGQEVLEGLKPYVSLGFTDASTFFYIGDDGVVGNNADPYASFTGSLGAQYSQSKLAQWRHSVATAEEDSSLDHGWLAMPTVLTRAVVRIDAVHGYLPAAHATHHDAEAVAAELAQLQRPVDAAHAPDAEVRMARAAHGRGRDATHGQLLCSHRTVVFQPREAKGAHWNLQLLGELTDSGECIHSLLVEHEANDGFVACWLFICHPILIFGGRRIAERNLSIGKVKLVNLKVLGVALEDTANACRLR